jgi:hypothetical protein
VPKVLVLYYSAYGHVEKMAYAVAVGARDVGATVDIKRVPELVPPEVAKASYYKTDQAAAVASVSDLANYDAIIVGTGTRFGRISSQMANFLGPGRRPVDAGRPAWQSWRGVLVQRHSARWPGDDAVFDHHQPVAFRDGDCRA